MAPIVELHTRSAFSLLGGGSLPEHLVERAVELGYDAIALTDEMDLGGAVCFAERAAERGVGAILGATILLDGPLSGAAPRSECARGQGPSLERPVSLVLLAESERGYRNICRLITDARMTCPRDRPRVQPGWLTSERLAGTVVLDGGYDGPISRALRCGDRALAEREGVWLRDTIAPGHLYFEVYDHLTHQERRLSSQVDDLGESLKVPRVVGGDVRYATPAAQPLYDVLTCVRHRVPLAEAGTRLLPSAQWHLLSPEERVRRWRERPHALRETSALGERLQFRFESLNPKLPHFPLPEGYDTDDGFLAYLTWEGARLRYPEMTDAHRRQIRHELALIKRLQLAGYFLITWDIVRFCRERGILVQGRGSAANSAVCYCLHITAIDPIGMKLLFERFLSEGRGDYPDIDIDISHEWREEAIQYVYDRYGRDRAALVCEQIRYRNRSAVRDAAWALGFEQDQIDRLSGQFYPHRSDPHETAPAEAEGHDDPPAHDPCWWIASAQTAGVHPEDPRLPMMAHLVTAMQGIPRHRSIHVGGMVLTAEPLCELVPIEPASMLDRTVIQWEKDDLPYSNLAKFDLLGLGMLSMLQKALVFLSEERGESFDLASIPQDDPKVYDALCRADTIGVFQIESRAQMNTLPRLKPRKFYDLVVEIALIRPGPIQGQMVHPYLRRRAGEEAVTYLDPALEPILERTLGVPIFQEQVMKIAIELAGFSPSQADELRRAMGFRRYSPKMDRLRQELHRGMRARGIEEEAREQIIGFLTAFGHYGFPESHSASFALIAYASSWLKVYHAPLFAACLINSQPMGFYSPSTLIQDARQHGVFSRPPCLYNSDWDCTLEPLTDTERSAAQTPFRYALRVGLRCVRGLGAKSRAKLEAASMDGPFESIRDVVTRTQLPPSSLAALAQAGAFDAFLADTARDRSQRRKALWAVLHAGRVPTEGLARFPRQERRRVDFAPLSRSERIVQDYAFVGLSTEGHPMDILRPHLNERGVLRSADLKEADNGDWVRVAGMVIVRQRPGTAKGFLFISLEDETGIANVMVHPKQFEAYRSTILAAAILEVHGVAQVEGDSIQLKGRRFFALDAGGVQVKSHDFH